MTTYYKFNIGDLVYNNDIKLTGRVYAYDFSFSDLYFVWYGDGCIYNNFSFNSIYLS